MRPSATVKLLRSASSVSESIQPTDSTQMFCAQSEAAAEKRLNRTLRWNGGAASNGPCTSYRVARKLILILVPDFQPPQSPDSPAARPSHINTITVRIQIHPSPRVQLQSQLRISISHPSRAIYPSKFCSFSYNPSVPGNLEPAIRLQHRSHMLPLLNQPVPEALEP